MAVKRYNFTTKSRTVITPDAKTLFMCLAEVNEVTGHFGGKLVFTPEQLEAQVKVENWGGSGKSQKPFGEVINGMLDEVVTELQASGKKVTKAEKLQKATDKDGNETGNFEMSCKNKDKPTVVGADRQKYTDFDKLVGNGSTVKARINLVPYTMSGKAGITAYIDYVLIKDLIEYSANGGDVFDEDDFTPSDCPFDAVEEEADTDGDF